jgi:hypothetical protein
LATVRKVHKRQAPALHGASHTHTAGCEPLCGAVSAGAVDPHGILLADNELGHGHILLLSACGWNPGVAGWLAGAWLHACMHVRILSQFKIQSANRIQSVKSQNACMDMSRYSSSSSKGNYRLTLLYLSEDESIGSWLLIEFCQELSPATNRGDKISRRRRRRPLH